MIITTAPVSLACIRPISSTNNAQALPRRADKLEAHLLERSSISAASVTEASLHRRQSATGSTARPLCLCPFWQPLAQSSRT